MSSVDLSDPGHGDSPAAWTAVVLMLIGVTAGTVFFLLDEPVWVYASAGFVLFGLLVGWVMSKLGYGVKGPKYQPKKVH